MLLLEKIDRWWPLICIAVLMTCMGLGCGYEQKPEYKIPDLVPVKGTLVLDGQPVAGVMVTLIPQGQTSGQSSSGITAADGTFECEYAMGGAGCPLGTYAVICSKLVTPDGRPIPDGKNAADVMAREMIPIKYRTLERPFKTVEVSSAGISNLQLELKSKG